MQRGNIERRQYEMLYNNRRDPLSETESEETSSEEDEPVSKFKYGKTTFNFLIDSKDRDWNGTDKDTFSFQVKFSPSGDSFETSKKTVIDNVNDKYDLDIITKKFSGNKSLSFPINVRNITSVSIHSLILPKRFLWLGQANYMDILNLRYIIVSVDEISNCYYGTNSNINNAIAIMYPLSATYTGLDINHVEFRDKGKMLKEFKPAPINTFNNLKFTIKDPDGKVLKFKNHILTIKTIDATVYDNFILIYVNEGINSEYRDGDLIKIRDFNTSNNVDINFINFINREEGHKIYTNHSFTDTSINSIGPLINKFTIMKPGKYDDEDPFLFEKDDSYIPTEITDNNVMGKILNTNLQLSLFLKIDTKVIEFDNLNSQII